ncbi:MAG: hypothetical protein WBO73_16060 [Gammaproteobacteria bacterium]|jgi:uncharacterized coiled-coil DUF342 family protein
MSDREKELDDLLESLKKRRDEINLQMHLGKAEAKELWQQTEDKWRHLRNQLEQVDNDTGDVAKDVGATAMLIADEIRQGYERLRKLL